MGWPITPFKQEHIPLLTYTKRNEHGTFVCRDYIDLARDKYFTECTPKEQLEKTVTGTTTSTINWHWKCLLR
jgi:hypothetical protein